ncbi:MAG: ABC transporter substrate-binding protein [Kiritimatiellia bacterium]
MITLGSAVPGQSNEPTKATSVVFLSPGQYDPVSEYWWSLCSDFMEAAAQDLGIDLRIYYANRNRALILQQAKEVVAGPHKPDFIVMQNLKQSALPIIALARKHDVKVILFNSGLSQEELLHAGGPRQQYPNWIGEILPDDREAGYLQAKSLVDRAFEMGLTDPMGKVQMLATAGTMSDTSAIERNHGLMTYVRENQQIVTLNRDKALPANWKRDTARKVFQHAFRQYPQTTVVWNANDVQALGVREGAIQIFDKKPGKDLLIAGIDWNPENITQIQAGEILSSIGGHFVEGVWALVLIYDYANGIDFIEEGVSFKTAMTYLDRDTISEYYQTLELRNRRRIHNIDYKRFSKIHNPDLQQYSFDTKEILMQLHTNTRTNIAFILEGSYNNSAMAESVANTLHIFTQP